MAHRLRPKRSREKALPCGTQRYIHGAVSDPRRTCLTRERRPSVSESESGERGQRYLCKHIAHGLHARVADLIVAELQPHHLGVPGEDFSDEPAGCWTLAAQRERSELDMTAWMRSETGAHGSADQVVVREIQLLRQTRRNVRSRASNTRMCSRARTTQDRTHAGP